MENKLVVINMGELVVEENTMNKYNQLKAQKEDLEKQLKEIENALKTELANLEVCETTQVGQFTYVVGGGFYSYEFDMETFKKDNPFEFMKYLKPRLSKETTALKYTKGK